MSGSWTVDRPTMPASYGVGDAQYGFEPIEWSWVVERLTTARSYWVAATRADGRPHLSPVWAVWTDGALHFFTDPESLKARCLRRDPRAVVHLESGDEVVILEGFARRRALRRKWCTIMSASMASSWATRRKVCIG